jgi:integrase
MNNIVSFINDVNLVDYFDGKKTKLKKANNMIFLSYPDGRACFLANSYMIDLENKKRSFYTIRQYANNIAHLIKYCHEKRINFYSMTDDLFIEYASRLRSETKKNSPLEKVRNSTTLNGILKSSLDFLDFVGRFNLDEGFIFDKIRATRSSNEIKIADRDRSVNVNGWYHKCLDSNTPVKKRSPINKENIDKLYDAIANSDTSKFIKMRRINMLNLLEATGARIGEIALLKVKDIEDALNAEKPLIKMSTLKKRSGFKERYVPVNKVDISQIKSYIKIYREKVISKTVGKEKDHGYLFISEINGEPLLTITLSNEFYLLKNAAKIEDKACAHMFRHRYITKQFISLIKQFNIENTESFRNALLDTQTLKQQIQQITGHTQLSSLDVYIDLAFKELTNIDDVVEKVQLTSKYESFENKLERLNSDLKNGTIEIKEYLDIQKELLNNIKG